MRAPIAAALTSLALVAAGCGAARSAPGGDPALGSDAAQLVPADALAFASVDVDRSSQQLQQLDELTRGLPARAQLLAELRKALAARGLDYALDVKPALGDELDIAVLGLEDGKPDAVALARPDDEAKLRALASRFDSGGEHYRVEDVGGWSVVADSARAFASVRGAANGRSLGDTAGYVAATDVLPTDVLARVYVTGDAVGLLRAQVPLLASAGKHVDWVAASVAAEGDALRVRIAKAPAGTAAGSSLFGAVPSGAIFATAFSGERNGARRLSDHTGGRLLGLKPNELAPLVSGPGVVYLRAGSTLVPVFGAELRPANPGAAVAAVRKIAARLQQKSGGALTLVVRRDGGRVFVADARAAIDDLRSSGPKLVDDPPFKDAVAAAGGGTSVLYADVQQLLPFVQLAGGLLGTRVPKALTDNLGHVGTIVAVGRRSGGVSRLDVRITKH